MTANTYSSPRYIRVQWTWIGMIYKMWHMWSSPHTIYNRSKSPWWIYTMDQDLHNGWRNLTYTGIKSWEVKTHEYWHDQGGSIYEMPPIWKVFYTILYEHMSYTWIEVLRLNIVVHHLITSHWCISLTNARSPTVLSPK